MKTGHFYSTGNSKEKRRQLQTVSCCNFIKLPQITTVTRAKTLFLSKVSAWKCKVDRTADGHSGGADSPDGVLPVPAPGRADGLRDQRQRAHQGGAGQPAGRQELSSDCVAAGQQLPLPRALSPPHLPAGGHPGRGRQHLQQGRHTQIPSSPKIDFNNEFLYLPYYPWLDILMVPRSEEQCGAGQRPAQPGRR